jgi:hypothetical protein
LFHERQQQWVVGFGLTNKNPKLGGYLLESIWLRGIEAPSFRQEIQMRFAILDPLFKSLWDARFRSHDDLDFARNEMKYGPLQLGLAYALSFFRLPIQIKMNITIFPGKSEKASIALAIRHGPGKSENLVK